MFHVGQEHGRLAPVCILLSVNGQGKAVVHGPGYTGRGILGAHWLADRSTRAGVGNGYLHVDPHALTVFHPFVLVNQ